MALIMLVLAFAVASTALSAINSSLALRCAFYFTAFLMLFALLPNLNVDSVSRSLYCDMEHVMTRHV